MVQWKLLTDAIALSIWDERLIQFPDATPLQMYGYGAQQREMGWQPLYFAAFDASGEIVAMMLGLLRRYPVGVGLVWCAGGPVGDVAAWGESLQQALLRETGARRLYCRFRCDMERNTNDALALRCQSWSRSWYMQHSGWSMELDLSQDDPLAHSARRWRRNLRRGVENKVRSRPWLNPDIGEMIAVYQEMEARKNLPQQFSRAALERLLRHCGDNFALFRGEDTTGRLLCFRGCLIAGRRAGDYLAATTGQGRELRASYLTLRELLFYCRERGVQKYDMGGIDPHRNPGVYAFKKETGARPVEGLGEWDWANRGWLRWFGNWAIMQRDRYKQPAASDQAKEPVNKQLVTVHHLF